MQHTNILDKRISDALSPTELGMLRRVLREHYETQFFEFEVSRDYKSDPSSMFRVALAARLIRQYKPRETLVVGSGLGVLEERVTSVTSIVSLDISTRTLLHQRSHGASWPLVSAAASALPFRDNAFDTVVCLEVLEHLIQPYVALEEIQRVCRRCLVISYPTYGTWSYHALGLEGDEYKDKNMTYRKALGERVGHISVPACSHTPDRLSKAGWVISGKWGQNSLVPPTYKFEEARVAKPLIRRIGRMLSVINNLDHLIAGWPWFRDHGIGTVYLFTREPEMTTIPSEP